MIRKLALAALLLVGSLPAWAGRPTAGSSTSPVEAGTLQVGQDAYATFSLHRQNGPPVRYFVSTPGGRAPLVLYIQGSGCAPAFVEMQPGMFASTIFSLTTVAHAGDYGVMVVDKPFAASGFPRAAGLATDCSPEFNAYFTLENWVDHIGAALAHARTLPWVDPSRLLVIGISEGATVAAALAARHPEITHVALVGASGPGQFYDFIVAAYRSGNQDQVIESLATLSAQLDEILADPSSATRFAWGHPYRRWSSFFRFSSVEALGRSRARVYLVSGMVDESVPILSTELIYSDLRSRGREVLFRRIPGAGHGLLPAGADFGENMPRLEEEYRRITNWFDADGRSASAP